MGLHSEYWCMAEISDNRVAPSQDPVGDAVNLINDAGKLLELGIPLSQLVDPCAKSLAGVFLPLSEEDFEASMPVTQRSQSIPVRTRRKRWPNKS